MEADFCCVVTDFLDCIVVNHDLFAVDLDTLGFFDGVSNLYVVD